MNGVKFIGESGARQIASTEVVCSDSATINCDHRSFAYTVCRMDANNQYVSVTIDDVTDQSRLEAIDEARGVEANSRVQLYGEPPRSTGVEDRCQSLPALASQGLRPVLG